jgi:hypothetical protein
LGTFLLRQRCTRDASAERPGIVDLNNNSKKGGNMKRNQSRWFAAILLGSTLVSPPAIFAAEKGGMMKDDKTKMMKDEKSGMMKEQDKMKDDTKDMKSKSKKSADKMKTDKMDQMKK